MPMQHLDENSAAVVKLANAIAQEAGLDYVGTEHILLAILRHGAGRGVEVLRGFGIDEARARRTIDDIVQRDKEDTWVFGRLPGSPHFRNVMALAIDEAGQFGSTQIGSEHLLLALLREKQSTGERALSKLGVSLKTARDAVAKLSKNS
jgi:ATP-dependent Clp protease ATP-binding subunit ClpC